jgi:xanthine dehydrogenase accessory factor
VARRSGRPLSTREALAHAARALDGAGPPVACVTVVGPAGHPLEGARLCVWREGVAGTLGNAALDDAAVAEARERLAGDGAVAVVGVEAEGERLELYLEPHRPPPSLVVVGAGHVARPLCTLGALLGFRVTVLDDRPEFATRERFPEAAEVRRADFSDPFRGVPLGPGSWIVLVTRGHRYDFEALRDLLGRPDPPAYIGMIGSRRRTRAALEALAREGIDAGRLARIHAPIGLDVGAETPEEIAVAVAAELVLVRRGGSGRPLRDVERVADRWLERGRRGESS